MVANIHAIFGILIYSLQYNFLLSESCTTGFIENKLSNKKYFCCSHICEDKQSSRYNVAWCCQSVCRENYEDICQNTDLSMKPTFSKRFLDKPAQFSTGIDKLTMNPSNQIIKKLVFSKSSLATTNRTEPTKQPLEKQSDNDINSKLRNIYFITTAFYTGFILLVSVTLYLFLRKWWLKQHLNIRKQQTMI